MAHFRWSLSERTPYLYFSQWDWSDGYAGLQYDPYGGPDSRETPPLYGTVPFNDFLGNVTMWIGDRKVPMTQLTPNSVSFTVPWDVQTENGSIRMLAEAAGENTPFYFPEAEASLPPPPNFPQAGVILRKDWSLTYVGPINTGEIIHVYAAGFGAVSPVVPDGAAAPSMEPLSRITQTFTCSNAEILYAGLAPDAVERVYQIDIRIGPTAGYQKFNCNLGAQAFTFLAL